MEYLERTETAGNTVNPSKQETKMTPEVQSNQVEIKINLSLDQVIEGLKQSGTLTNFVVSSDDFREKVDEIAGTAAETTFEEKADEWINDYISSNAYEIVDTLETNIETVIERNIDISEIASEVKDDIDVDSQINEWIDTQLHNFIAGGTCNTAKEAARVVIDVIRYDLAMHLREKQGGAGSTYEHTITNSLRQFVDERIEVRINEEKEKYLKNKDGYMQETVDKLNQQTVTAELHNEPSITSGYLSELYNEPSITVEQFKQFINGLDLFQVTKERIIEEFNKVTINFTNK